MIRQTINVQLYPRGFKFSDGTKIYFDYGKFDKWCVYVEDCHDINIPLDTDYLTTLRGLAEMYGWQKVYNTFRMVYDVVKLDSTQQECLKVCKEASLHFKHNTLSLWIILFMTMMAEENKKYSILGKRIKHLAVVQTLNTTQEIDTIAHSMEGKRWWQLDAEMQQYGI